MVVLLILMMLMTVSIIMRGRVFLPHLIRYKIIGDRIVVVLLIMMVVMIMLIMKVIIIIIIDRDFGYAYSYN